MSPARTAAAPTASDTVELELNLARERWLAHGTKYPLFAEARSYRELRVNVATAIRAHFGHERAFVFVIGFSESESPR